MNLKKKKNNYCLHERRFLVIAIVSCIQQCFKQLFEFWVPKQEKKRKEQSTVLLLVLLALHRKKKTTNTNVFLPQYEQCNKLNLYATCVHTYTVVCMALNLQKKHTNPSAKNTMDIGTAFFTNGIVTSMVLPPTHTHTQKMWKGSEPM